MRTIFNTMTGAGLLLLGGGIAGVLLLAQLQGQGPLLIVLPDILHGPTFAADAWHWLGSDELGRDVLARVAAGLRLSLLVSVSVTLATGLLGVPLGLVAAATAFHHRWGWTDALLLRLADVVLSFPGLLLALALAALLGPSAGNVILALSLLGWVGFFRLTRVQALRVNGLPYVQAARVAGLPEGTVLGRHVLPNIAGPLLVEAVVVFAGSLVAEAGLSFLGVGVPPPLPSLGGMIREGIRYLLLAPHLVLAPAVMLLCLVVGANLLAEGLRRALSGGMR